MKWIIEFSKSFIVEITGIRVIMFLSNNMTKHIAFYNGKQVYLIFLNQLVVTSMLCTWLIHTLNYRGVKWSAQSCLPLCDCMDSSLPGPDAPEIFQARILEWVAVSYSRGSSQPSLFPLHWQVDSLLVCHLIIKIPWKEKLWKPCDGNIHFWAKGFEFEHSFFYRNYFG